MGVGCSIGLCCVRDALETLSGRCTCGMEPLVLTVRHHDIHNCYRKCDGLGLIDC